MSDIEAAIARARYNEAVVVTVDDGSSSPRELVLVACLDGENGGIVWKDAASASDGSGDAGAAAVDAAAAGRDVGIVRHLRTKRWALPMLNDRRRNMLYNSAVRSAFRAMVKRANCKTTDAGGSGTETIRILDVGSGTGLLAMMGAQYALDAVKEQASPSESDITTDIKVQVTSVEMASAMARLARMTVEENGLSETVVVVETHSADVGFGMNDGRGVNETADICTSELLESGLLGEGVLPALRDAWKRHLMPDAIIVPRRARVFAVLVEGGVTGGAGENAMNVATSFYGPELQSFKEASGGVWLSTKAQPAAEGDTPSDEEVLLGAQRCNAADESRGVGGITIPLHADAMLDEEYRDKSAHLANDQGSDFRGLRPLADPTMVLDFDFASGLDAEGVGASPVLH